LFQDSRHGARLPPIRGGGKYPPRARGTRRVEEESVSVWPAADVAAIIESS
jgi:hypothetical protein